jgi:hypothetical protein
MERSSRVVALQKPNRPHTPSRVLRRTVVPKAPALPQPHGREVTGCKSLSSSGVVVSMLLLSLSQKKDRSDNSYSRSGEEKEPAGEIRRL